ncbi:MAG: biotin/lipoyl-containing protein [Myxococcota bacterium]
MSTYHVLDADPEVEARTFEITTQADGTYAVLLPNGEARVVDAYQPEPGRMHLVVDGVAFDVDARAIGADAYRVLFANERHELTVLNERQLRMRSAGGGSGGAGGPELVSPMAGKIVAVEVAQGDAVEVDQGVVIVEAMKMENELKAHIAGTISRVLVAPGDTVEIGDVLVTIDSNEG